MKCTLARYAKFSFKVIFFHICQQQCWPEVQNFWFLKISSSFGIKGTYNQNKSINYHLRLDSKGLTKYCSFELKTWFHLFIHSHTLEDLRPYFMAVFCFLLLALRQFLKIESPYKWWKKNLFHVKSFFCSWGIYIFVLTFWLHRKCLVKKVNVNSKIYDITDWVTNN